MEQFVNLTPHDIRELSTGRKFPPSGRIARVTTQSKKVMDFDRIPIFSTDFGTLEGLPEQKDGVMYIISALCLEAARKLGRYDVVAPGNVQRDRLGNPIGCLGFRY